jgi:hypothetical protein
MEEDIKRWYDKSSKLGEMMKVLSCMSERELSQVSVYLFQVVKLYRRQKNSMEDNLSIGRDKLFGYYMAYQKRRWYDQDPSLRSAINIISTLPVKDIDDVIDGFIQALKESGQYDIYYKKMGEIDKDL